MNRKMIAWGSVALLISATGLAYALKGEGQGGASRGAGGRPTPVEMVKVESAPLVEDIRAVGTFLSNESTNIQPEVPGRITAILFQEGQAVKKGDTLIQLDDSIAKAELDKAQANYELAQLTHKRTASLTQKGATSQQARDEATARLQEAKASYELAKVRLEKTAIRAPFDGLIGLRAVSEGDYAEIAKPITHLEMVHPIKVEFSVPEKHLSALQPEQKVNVTTDAWPGEIFEGAIFAVDPKIDPETRNVRIKALVQNPEMKLRPGMFAYVSVSARSAANALLVPEEAIAPKGSQNFVFRVVDGKAVSTLVKLGLRKGGKVEVREGLSAEDMVITAGHLRVKDGAEVLTPEQMQQKAASGSAGK